MTNNQHQKFFNLLLITTLCITSTLHAEVQDEVLDKDTSSSLQMFWRSFEDYENKQENQILKEYQNSWKEISEEKSKKLKDSTNQRREFLLKSTEDYRKSLSNFDENKNTPYILLNLAIALFELAKFEDGRSSMYLAECEESLSLVLEKYPSFEFRDRSLYLAALSASKLSKNTKVYQYWNELAAMQKPSIYTAQANVVIGDEAFNKESANKALSFYERAINVLLKINNMDVDFDLLRAQYRALWASYRSADLEKSIRFAESILTPGRSFQKLNESKRIITDTSNLLADSLFELGNTDKIVAHLNSRKTDSFGADIGLRLMQRYDNSNSFAASRAVGNVIEEKFQSQAYGPLAMKLFSDILEKAGESDSAIQALESVAIILASDSLWMQKNQHNLVLKSEMEVLAKDAAVKVANYYYQQGLSSGSTAKFISATHYYKILSKQYPNDPLYNEWTLRRANGLYFSNQYSNALSSYESLKKESRLSPEQIEIAFYQAVLTQEKIVQSEISKSMELGKLDSDNLKLELTKLETLVNDFVLKHAGTQRANDVLLLMASNYRDVSDYVQAKKFWTRCFNSNPNSHQRAIAIRGILTASVKLDDAKTTVELSGNLLKSEDWKTVGPSVANEALGVLSTALTNVSQKLQRDAKNFELGQMLTRYPWDFPLLPKRELFIRDGAYWLAISGEWSKALLNSEIYLEKNLKEYEADMKYLKARSEEYLMRFSLAAQSYFNFAKDHATHPKSRQALLRSLEIAKAERNLLLASKVADLIAERSLNNRDRIDALKNAYQNANLAGDRSESQRIETKLLSQAKNIEDQYEIRYLIAMQSLKDGRTEKAVAELEKLSANLTKNSDKIGKDLLAKLEADVHLNLAQDQKKDFDQILLKNSDNLKSLLDRKAKIFESIFALYNRSMQASKLDASLQSRFELASLSSQFSEEILSALNSPNSNLKLSEVQRYRETSKRFAEISRKLHAGNLALRIEDPKKQANNEWIRRSSLALTGKNDGGRALMNEAVSKASFNSKYVQFEFPTQWSEP